MDNFEPKIIGFFCRWCALKALDNLGKLREKLPSNLGVIWLMCIGRLDIQFVLEAFREGADGVLILGCHFGDCHYQEGNYYTYRKYLLFKMLLEELGVEKERVLFAEVSPKEGNELIGIISGMIEHLKRIGPFSRVKKGE